MAAFLTSWEWEPELLVGFAAALGLYGLGWRRVQRRGRGREVLAPWRAWCFVAGVATVGIALLSPIGVYSELFFFMHMTQHLMLVLVAAPLLLLGAPLLPILWALPRRARLALGGLMAPGSPLAAPFAVLTHPLMAVSVYVAVMAIWHVPPFYDAAQGRTIIHEMEHSLFLGSALLFWWPVIHPAGGNRRLSYGAAIPYFLPPMLEGNLIGALLTFANRPLYATYQQVPRVWGISVVEDQQLAGLIMWVPGGLAFLVPVSVLMLLLLQRGEPAGREEGRQ